MVWFPCSFLLACLPSRFLGYVYGLDVSHDGSVVVAASANVVIARNTTTLEVLWRKEMLGKVWTLRVHGGVVAVPVEGSNTVVLDVTTGHQLHALQSAGYSIHGICVFEGLASDVICFVDTHAVLLY